LHLDIIVDRMARIQRQANVGKPQVRIAKRSGKAAMDVEGNTSSSPAVRRASTVTSDQYNRRSAAG
jgi:hypothetical protein